MKKPCEKNKTGPRRRWLYAALMFGGVFFTVSAVQSLSADWRGYEASRSEYEELAALYYSEPILPVFPLPDSPPQSPPDKDRTASEAPAPTGDQAISDTSAPGEDGFLFTSSLDALAGLNPDFVGWLSIEGVLDYPVVRGRDNSYYLNRTFTGQKNPSGAIFMDYRLTRGFYREPVCLIYGHNMRDGSLFAPLAQYLDPAFMDANPVITVASPEGETLEYRVFAAKYTDMWDKIYSLDFSGLLEEAPAGASRFLLLSTCAGGADRDARLLVYAGS